MIRTALLDFRFLDFSLLSAVDDTNRPLGFPFFDFSLLSAVDDTNDSFKSRVRNSKHSWR